MRSKLMSLMFVSALALAGSLCGSTSASAQRQAVGADGFDIHNSAASSRCIGIANNNAGIWDCTQRSDQLWHWGDANSAGWRQLVNGDGKCLGVLGGGDANGAQVVAWPCLGPSHLDQYWEWDLATDQAIYNYLAVNDPTTIAEVIGVSGGSTKNGASIVLWKLDGSANQSWF